MTSFISNKDNGLTMNAMVKVFWNMELEIYEAEWKDDKLLEVFLLEYMEL